MTARVVQQDRRIDPAETRPSFLNAPEPFPSKLPSASLNLSTYIALYDYGYRNVYELGPTIDIDASHLELERGGP